MSVSITPFGLPVEQAAAYVGVSLSTFERMTRKGVMPKPRMFPGFQRVVWLRPDLEEAMLRLPESTHLPPDNTGKKSPQ